VLRHRGRLPCICLDDLKIISQVTLSLSQKRRLSCGCCGFFESSSRRVEYSTSSWAQAEDARCGSQIGLWHKGTRTCTFGRYVAEAVAVDEDVANIKMNTECALCISQASFFPSTSHVDQGELELVWISHAVAASACPNTRLEDSHRCKPLQRVPTLEQTTATTAVSPEAQRLPASRISQRLAGHCANGVEIWRLASKQRP
jgi:hypothetical protein